MVTGLARIRGSSVASAVRIAVAHYLALLDEDPAFRRLMIAALQAEQAALDRLKSRVPPGEPPEQP
jgi:hypothetical protein